MKLLLISYHFRPFDVVASKRADSFFDYLPQHGIEIDVVTHDWNNQRAEDDNIYIKEFEQGKVYHLPKPVSSQVPKYNAILRKLYILFNWFRGNLDVRPDLFASEAIFKSFIFEHLKTHSYDLVLAIYSPSYHFKLAYQIHQKFGIPYVLDSRDLWDKNVNLVTKQLIKRSFTHYFQYYFNKKYWEKWHNKALFYTTVVPMHIDFMQDFIQTKGYVVANGYQEVQTSPIVSKSRFQITYTGNLYDQQDLTVFIQALRKLKQQLGKDFYAIKCIFVGLKPNAAHRVKQLFEQAGLSPNLELLVRMPYAECLELMRTSSMLYYPFFEQGPVAYPVKILEYIATGVPIIGAPLDVTGERLVNDTEAGLVTNDATELANYIEQVYKTWQNGEKVLLPMNPKKEAFSRENQVAKLAQLIKKHLDS